MDYRLKVFVTVSQLNGFNKAAKELNISQPAVSKHIQELEANYNTRLFDREGKRVSLTDAGKLLLQHANKILSNYKQLQFDMNKLTGTFVSEISLGASTTVAQYVLPSVLADFIKEYPQINIDLISGNTRDIENYVLEQKIDIGIVEGNRVQPLLKYDSFLRDEIVLITRSSGMYGHLTEIDIESLKSYPLVIREAGSGTLDVIETELAKHNVNIHDLLVLLRLGSTESIKHFLSHTDCLAFVSIRAVLSELRLGYYNIIDLKGLQIERSFNFVSLQGGGVNNIVQVFTNFAKRYNKKL